MQTHDRRETNLILEVLSPSRHSCEYIPGDLPYAVRTRELAESPPDHRTTDEIREEIDAKQNTRSDRRKVNEGLLNT